MRSKELGPAGDSEESRRRGVNQLNHLEGESGGGNAEGRGVRLRLPLAFRASPERCGGSKRPFVENYILQPLLFGQEFAAAGFNIFGGRHCECLHDG